MKKYTSLEICAGAGGEAIGLEQAGFEHVALLEIDKSACETLRFNRPNWKVLEEDITKFNALPYTGVDLLSGGVPCQPFSHGGNQIGCFDERDLFPEAARITLECNPKAVLLENVRGLLDSKFEWYRQIIQSEFKDMGYISEWKLLNSSDFGVPQLRPRAIFIALKPEYLPYFKWPEKTIEKYTTVADALFEEMSSLGWQQVNQWRTLANKVAPTLVGGSKKHGGADLGPTRAKRAWADLGVDGHGVVDFPPAANFEGMPRLTVRMAALIQGFPPDWIIRGKKTPAYRQVGNAFPPPVARALGEAILNTFKEKYKKDEQTKKENIEWQKREKEQNPDYADISLNMLARS